MSTTPALTGPVASPLDDLADEALLAAFEGDGLPPGSFHHRHHVRRETLWSDRARQTFVLPDRPPTA
ncbi:MAG TPA: hypothetical protein VFT38_13615 [Vicinamibacteria bacterium]|nr:hypothetical protein [Vicinamibacteria bacterium]